MKLTTKILLFLFLVLVAGLFSSNIILKRQYDSIDRNDIYWTYNKVIEQPFKYLNITGGNSTNIYYEQSNKPSVRLLQEWVSYHDGKIKAYIKNDTLFLNFDYVPATPFEKVWLENAEPVRIFSPELLSVTGNNTNFEMQKLKQKNITVNMSGNSRFEIESMYPEMDSINVTQRDSTEVIFEMSPDYRIQTEENRQIGKIGFHDAHDNLMEEKGRDQKYFNEYMTFKSVSAMINGHSILDIGHGQIQNLNAQISDSSAIVLSGNALKKINGTILKK